MQKTHACSSTLKAERKHFPPSNDPNMWSCRGLYNGTTKADTNCVYIFIFITHTCSTFYPTQGCSYHFIIERASDYVRRRTGLRYDAVIAYKMAYAMTTGLLLTLRLGRQIYNGVCDDELLLTLLRCDRIHDGRRSFE